MNFPTLTYQVDFAHDPSSGSFTWTDLTSRALAFSCTRGRSHEQSTVDAGSAAIEWKNTDGALDPTNTGSAYYPNVIPYRRVQAKATYSAVTYNIYTGVVERWPMQWQDEFGTVPTQCTDTFAILANKTLVGGYAGEVLTDSPTLLYMLNEAAGSTSVGDTSGNGGASLIAADSVNGAGGVTLGVTGIMPIQTQPAAHFNASLTSGSGDYYKGTAYLGAAPTLSDTGGSYECWLQIDATMLPVLQRNGVVARPWDFSTLVFGFINTLGTHSFMGLFLYADNSGAVKPFLTSFLDATPSVNISGWGGDLNDGQVHHLLLSADGQVFVDGVDVGSGIGVTGGATNYTSRFVIGGAFANSAGNTFNTYLRGTIQAIAYYPVSTFNSTRALAHYTAGLNAFAGETADARITRILGYAGWTGATSFDACTTKMLAANSLDGQSALAAIQAVEASEGGIFYEGKDGTLTYKSRTTRMSTTASSYTFGDGTSELPYVSVAFDFDPTFIYNDIQIQRDGASAYYASDATSQGHYGQRTYAKTLGIQSDAETVDAANWLLAEYKAPHLRVASMTLDPAANPALWPAVLNMDIGTRVTVKRRPHGSSNTISADFFVEQLTHNVQPGVWITTVALSPIPVQAFILNDPTFGLLDTGRLGY